MWITFDCFGTLVDWHSGFSRILTPIAGPRTRELMERYHEFERKLEQEKPFRSYREILTDAVRHAANKIGVDCSESQAAALPRSWGALPLFGDTEEMLEELRGMGARLAVLTNCDNDLFELTQRSFSKPFDLVVTAERVQDYKPSLAHFRQFAELSGAADRDWIHVACSLYHDIEPARRLGIPAIWLDRDRTGQDPSMASARVESAREVSNAIRRVRG